MIADLYIFHAGTNGLSLHNENCNSIVNVAKLLKSDQNTLVISTIVPHADNSKEKATEVNKLFAFKFCGEVFPFLLGVFVERSIIEGEGEGGVKIPPNRYSTSSRPREKSLGTIIN